VIEPICCLGWMLWVGLNSGFSPAASMRCQDRLAHFGIYTARGRLLCCVQQTRETQETFAAPPSYAQDFARLQALTVLWTVDYCQAGLLTGAWISQEVCAPLCMINYCSGCVHPFIFSLYSRNIFWLVAGVSAPGSALAPCSRRLSHIVCGGKKKNAEKRVKEGRKRLADVIQDLQISTSFDRSTFQTRLQEVLPPLHGLSDFLMFM